jgi:hypothetical protein
VGCDDLLLFFSGEPSWPWGIFGEEKKGGVGDERGGWKEEEWKEGEKKMKKKRRSVTRKEEAKRSRKKER